MLLYLHCLWVVGKVEKLEIYSNVTKPEFVIVKRIRPFLPRIVRLVKNSPQKINCHRLHTKLHILNKFQSISNINQ